MIKKWLAQNDFKRNKKNLSHTSSTPYAVYHRRHEYPLPPFLAAECDVFFTGDNNSSTTAVDKWSSKVIYVLIGLNIFSGDFRRAYRKEAFNLYIDEGELFVRLQIESFLAKRGPVLVHFFIQTTMFPCSFLRHRKSLMFGMPSLDQFV